MTDLKAPPRRSPQKATERKLERSRRRFARRHWRRRWLAWRYVAVVLGLVGVVGFGLWALYLSSWLSVSGVDVTGTHALTPAQIQAVAAVPRGGPLVDADLPAIRARVAALPSVRAVDVSRQWPDHVRIKVTERVPVAVVELGGSLRAMDDEGVVFSAYKKAPPGLPLVQSDPGLDAAAGAVARQAAAAVISSLPAVLAQQVDHVEIHGADGVDLILQGDRRVIWGSSSQSADKAQVLGVLLSHDAKTYDVSVPGRPTTS